MGPTQSKLFTKIPAMVLAGKTVSAELIALSDAAIAALGAAPVVVPPTPAEIAALYDAALLKTGAQAVSVQRGLPVPTEATTKAALIDAIVVDGGDGVITAAEQSAIDAYLAYLALDAVALQADADGRVPAVVFTIDEDTVPEMARALLADDAF